jgi:hypothetical protein
VLRILLIAVMSFGFMGCSVLAIRKHQPNFKSVRMLSGVKGSYYVKDIRAARPDVDKALGKDSMSCRLTTFNTPAGMTLADYIRAALTDELDAAGKKDPKGRPIAVTVKTIESDTSGFDKGTWHLDFDYEIGSRHIDINTQTQFESAFMADTACRNTANALTDALTDNFKKLYSQMAR